MKLFLCTLGGRVRKIRASSERNARVRFQKSQRMWSNSVIVKLIK